MNSLFDDGDFVRDAEQAAQAWVDRYVGVHRAEVDESDPLADLVEAEIAIWHGCHALAITLQRRAAIALGGWGRVYEARDEARAMAEERIVAEVRDQMHLWLGADTREPCRTPDECDRLEATAAQELRLPSPAGPGCCKWCGGVR